MKEYKDTHMKIFSLYTATKNIQEKEFASGITHFPVCEMFYDTPKIAESRILLLDSSKRNINNLLL